MLCRRKTSRGQLAWEGDEGRHQQDMQTHDAEVEFQQTRFRQHFAEAAFDHPRFAVEHMVFTVRYNPDCQGDTEGRQHGDHPEQGV
ncbi:hypothetical protein D3C76_1237290 [compost metagenome]